MTYVVCSKCRNPLVMVPSPNWVCFDCCYPSPEERNREWDRLRGALDRSQVSLRDKFAMAALAVSGSAAEAYRLADQMIEERKRLPESS